MKFSRTKDDIALLERGGEPTAAQLMGCLWDLCQDVRTETGSGPEQKTLGDTDALERYLPWLGRMVLRLYERSIPQLGSVSLRGRLGEISRELKEMDQALSREEALRLELVQKEGQLKARKEELGDAGRQKAALQARCLQLEQELARFEQGDLKGLAQEQHRLEEEQRAQELRAAALREQIGAGQQKLEVQKLEYAALERQQQELQQVYEEAWGQCAALREALETLEAGICDGDKTLREREEAIEAAKARQETLLTGTIPQREALLAQKETELAQAQDRLAALEEKLAEAGEALVTQQESLAQAQALEASQARTLKEQAEGLEEKRKELSRQEEELRRLEREEEALRKNLGELDRERRDRDFPAARKMLEETIRAREAELRQFEELQESIRRSREESQRQKEGHSRRLDQDRKQRDALAEETGRLGAQVQELEGQIAEAAAQWQALKDRRESLLREKEDQERWLQGQEVRDCLTQIQYLQGRAALLAKARAALVEEHRCYAAWTGMSQEEFEKQISFRENIDDITIRLDRFQRAYREVLASVGGEV